MSHPRQPGGRAAGPRGAAAPRSRPEVGRLLAGEGERPESSRTKLPPPRQQAGCANFGARSRRPQPTTEFLPADPWTPGRPAQSSTHPRRLALEPLPATKPPPRGQSPGPLPSVASPRLLPDKKSYRSPAALGARRGSLRRTYQSGSPSSTSRTATCLARNDSDGCCSE